MERTPDELRAEVDELAQRYLGVSGDQFLRARDAGKLGGDAPALLYLLVLSDGLKP